jgi:hypothetical protein
MLAIFHSLMYVCYTESSIGFYEVKDFALKNNLSELLLEQNILFPVSDNVNIGSRDC